MTSKTFSTGVDPRTRLEDVQVNLKVELEPEYVGRAGDADELFGYATHAHAYPRHLRSQFKMRTYDLRELLQLLRKVMVWLECVCIYDFHYDLENPCAVEDIGNQLSVIPILRRTHAHIPAEALP